MRRYLSAYFIVYQGSRAPAVVIINNVTCTIHVFLCIYTGSHTDGSDSGFATGYRAYYNVIIKCIMIRVSWITRPTIQCFSEPTKQLFRPKNEIKYPTSERSVGTIHFTGKVRCIGYA